jgi:hypothetical protein
MALDGPYDEGTSDGRLERHLRSSAPDAGDAGARAEPAEARTRAEYYDARRAADAEAAGIDESAQRARTERSGWDTINADDRPPHDAFRVGSDRTTHILDGDPGGGGGHRSGTGKPGKTEFPASWDDKKVMGYVLDVARRPDSPPVHQHWNDRWVCTGTRDRVEVSVVVLRSGEVWTAWPEEGGPGVVRNPKKGTS